MGNAWNGEFRDLSKEANYPFTGPSSLRYNDTQLDQGLILDVILYPLESMKLPFYLATIRGGGSEEKQLIIIIKDDVYNTVCTFTADYACDSVPGYDSLGRVVGILTYDRVKLLDMIGKAGFGEFNFEKEDAELCPGCCYMVAVDGTVGIEAQDGTVVSGAACISAANGVTFTLSGGDVQVNLYGEMRTLDVPVKSINNITLDHYWLAAHPDSALRVATDLTGKTVTVGKGRDFTYDDQTRNS